MTQNIQKYTEIVNEYEAKVEEIEATVIALLREMRDAANEIRSEAQALYEETGDRETALAIDSEAYRLTGGLGLSDRLRTIGQGVRL